ncbi:MAG: phospho-N-acetylmuramoyl-pentapeptide-transferase [Arsenophonus sp.]|nr:MAG: phospho-N-acetylmuramoyl-pentapeptide-transferase [Arsenophonus sp.]
MLIIITNFFLNLNWITHLNLRFFGSLFTSFFILLIFGPFLINYLKKKKVHQIIRKEGPNLHKKKKNVPTMGGILIIFSITISVLLWSNLQNIQVWYVLITLLMYSIIGFIDDYKKIKNQNSTGLRSCWKYFFQSISALLIGFFLCVNNENYLSIKLILPLLNPIIIKLNFVTYIILIYFILVGTSNGVNLTDGLDGLAIMPVILISFGSTIMLFIIGNINIANYFNVIYLKYANELNIIYASIIGSGLGFLWFNTYPSQIIMGDTGSLGLGGILGILAILTHQEFFFFIMSGVFIIETISVILQMISFKLYKKRIFYMAPIHHHYELKGYSEPKIVIRIWIISIIFLLISLIIFIGF